MTENKELAIVSGNSQTLSAIDVRKQVNLIQDVLNNIMQKDVHYGVIQGCGDKPTLLKPGAEKIAMTFRLGCDFEELPGSVECDEIICYKINCKLIHIPTGNVVGNGRGTCNSKEKKYLTRMVYLNKASDEEKAIGKPEKRKGKDGREYDVLIVPQNPWDVQNTIYKMACKRAQVAAILNATAASDIFTQDLEDMPENVEQEVTPATKAPTEKAPEANKPSAEKECSACGAIIDEAVYKFSMKVMKKPLCRKCQVGPKQ